MKRMTMCFLAVCLAAVLGLSVTAATPRLIDDADWFSATEEETLSAELDRISETYQIDTVVVTAADLEGMSAEAYAAQVYDAGGYGYRESRDGTLLLLSDEGRYILVNGIAYMVFDDVTMDNLIDEILFYLDIGDVYGAVDAYIFGCESEYAAVTSGDYRAFDDGYTAGGTESGMTLTVTLVAIGVGVLAAFLIVSGMKAQLRSVKAQQAAAYYVRPGSLQLSRQDELFLYSHVTRVAKPKNDSNRSSGGGGGSARGGRSF